MDKFDTRIYDLTPLRPEFLEFIQPVEAAIKNPLCNQMPRGWTRDEHFGAKGSLQEFGIDGYFFGWFRHKRNDGRQIHKLELRDVGLTGKSRIYADLERVVATNPADLEILRMDLCADMRDVEVSFARWNMCVARKRRGGTVLEFENPEFCHLWGLSGGETMYFGRRNNCVRVYDKVAELRYQYGKEVARFKRDEVKDEAERLKSVDRDGNLPNVEIPIALKTFHQTWGIHESDTITRVERVMNGKGIPESIMRLGELHRLEHFDPFANVILYSGMDCLPPREDFTFTEYHAGRWFRQMQQAEGMDKVRHYFRKHNPGNHRRELAKYEPFFRNSIKGFSREDLVDRYQTQIRRQLAA